ncbi:MAG TPA: hemolysin III family protein [Polyangia bacterium]
MILGAQPVSSFSHLFAAAFALIAAIPMVRLAGGHPERKLALLVYVSSVVLTLAISGIYHSCEPGGSARAIMQRVDHGAIWCLIAGTFTAVHGIMWNGFWRRGLLAFIWTYAVMGIVLQVLWFQEIVGSTELMLYLGLGWVGIFSIRKLGRQIGWASVLPMLYAGLAYTAGAILEAFNWPVVVADWIEAHEVFHFAVIIGVALHWRFIRKLVLHHAPRLHGHASPTAAPAAEPTKPVAVQVRV